MSTHEEVKQYNFLFQTRVCELLTLPVKLASCWPRLLMLKKKNYWYVPDLLAILFRSGDKVGENKAYRIASFFCLSGTLRGSTLSPCEQKLVAMPRPSLTFPKPVVQKLFPRILNIFRKGEALPLFTRCFSFIIK